MIDTRLLKLIPQTIKSFDLDLSGLTVLTEAASGAFVVTPIIAALARADRVIAVTKESRYASVDEVAVQTRELASMFGLANTIEIRTERSLDLFSAADIVTNLGFVRPLDDAAVEAMKPTAVVPLMCEAWEFRPSDVDVIACKGKGVLVLGTDEHHPAVGVFSYSGWLALKLLLEATIEVHRNRILIVSHDRFGVEIEENLRRAGLDVSLISDLRSVPRGDLSGADVLIICDYTRDDCIIGSDGDISCHDLADIAPSIRVVQFSGVLDIAGLKASGIVVYPGEFLPPHRMVRTLAALGPRPIAVLHTAGLKIGEVASRIRKAVAGAAEILAAIQRSCPFAQTIPGSNADET